MNTRRRAILPLPTPEVSDRSLAQETEEF